MQNAHGAPKEIPPGGAQKSASNPKVSKRCESETQINKVGGQETKMKKEAKFIKTCLEKVSLTTVRHFRPPQGRLLEKKVPDTL